MGWSRSLTKYNRWNFLRLSLQTHHLNDTEDRVVGPVERLEDHYRSRRNWKFTSCCCRSCHRQRGIPRHCHSHREIARRCNRLPVIDCCRCRSRHCHWGIARRCHRCRRITCYRCRRRRRRRRNNFRADGRRRPKMKKKIFILSLLFPIFFSPLYCNTLLCFREQILMHSFFSYFLQQDYSARSWTHRNYWKWQKENPRRDGWVHFFSLILDSDYLFCSVF